MKKLFVLILALICIGMTCACDSDSSSHHSSRDDDEISDEITKKNKSNRKSKDDFFDSPVEIPDGMDDDYTYGHDTPEIPYCRTCHGTGTCDFCNGSGITRNPYYPSIESVCTSCGGTGKCSLCGGDGEY